MMDDTVEDDVPSTQPVDNRVLKDVIAYVEVRSANDNRSDSVRKELELLGATVVKKFTDDVTHVVFKEGCTRTKTKALKKCVHFVSVLWVDRCKQNQEHVSERMFPAYVPKSKGTPSMFTKMKKAKSMQPRDFDEEIANSAERVRRKRKKLEALHQARYSDSTPPYSPRAHPAILVQETQPRSSLGDNEFVFTPVRLAIPDTPPGMREKMKELKMLKDDDAEYTASDMENEAKQEGLRFLQKKLFEGVSETNNTESPDITLDEDPLDKSTSDAAVNKDILSLVTEINASLSRPGKAKKKYYDDFSEDTSLNCSQDSIDLLNTKDSHESPIPKSNLVESECVVNENVKGSEKTANSLAVEPERNSVEKGKRKSRRSTRLSLQPFHINDYPKETVNKKNSKRNVKSTEKEKISNLEDFVKTDDMGNTSAQSEDLKLQLSMSTQNDPQDVDLQLSLSPIRATNNLDERSKSGNKPEPFEDVNKRNKIESCDKENKPSKRGRRRSSLLLNRKSIKANELTCSLDLDSKAAGMSNPQNEMNNQNSANIDQEYAADVVKDKKESYDCDKENKPSKPGRQRSSQLLNSKSTKATKSSGSLDLEGKVAGELNLTNEIRNDHTSDNVDQDNNSDVVNEVNNINTSDNCDKENKPSKHGRKRSSASSKCKSNKKNDISNIDIVNPQNNENQNPDTSGANSDQTEKPAKGKRVTKKKLMSLTDMMDQHSVLIEPSKASNDERKQLIDTSTVITKKKGRRSKVNQNASENSGRDTDSDNVARDEITNAKDATEDPKKGHANEKRSEVGKRDNKLDNGAKRKKRGSDQQSKSKPKKSKTVLADETHIDNPEVLTERRPLTDVSAKLNLTKDKSLTCSIRETTLSMSMSRAYPDGDMSSILASARRSIDEFSQKNGRKRKSKQGHVNGFTSIREVNVSTSSSDSDRSWKRKKKNPSLVMTSLHSNEQDVVIQVVKKLGGFVITDNVNETTTHVICGEPRRTLNILQCLARGLWLVSKEWVIKSLEAGEWIPEESFECINFFPSCRVARLEREDSMSYYRQTLFTNAGLIYISGRSSPPRPSLVQLVKLCGGQITTSLEKANVYVGADFHPGITCVKTTWLLDCIKGHQTLPLDRYSLDRPKRESSPVY